MGNSWAIRGQFMGNSWAIRGQKEIEGCAEMGFCAF